MWAANTEGRGSAWTEEVTLGPWLWSGAAVVPEVEETGEPEVTQDGEQSGGRRAGTGPVRVAVLGGGPAGAFCAIWLCRLSRANGRPVEVVIFDHKSFEKPGPAGCNMCAGIIPGSLVQNMQALGMDLPEHVIQRRIEGYRLETRGGALDLAAPADSTLYATFRGPGPLGMYPSAEEGFDWFLLTEAQRQGAHHVSKLVTDLCLPSVRNGPYQIVCRDGSNYEADVVVGAFGVNSNLAGVFERLGFGYRAPRTLRVRQAEISLTPEFIEQNLRNRVLIFAMGWPGIRFAAITPKRQHVTVTLIGDNPDRSRMEEFLRAPEVRRHLPKDWSLPSHYCSCAPQLPISAARNPVHDRLVVIGDANLSRYLKNGIESSFYTAMWAAKAIVTGNTSRQELRKSYLRLCHHTYLADNAYGRALLRAHDLISRSAVISRAHIDVARDEQGSSARAKPLTDVLWGTFTGNIPYRSIVRKAANLRLQARLARAVLKGLCRQLAARPARTPEVRSRPLATGNKADAIVIIGGGPAGAACAITLATEGRSAGLTPKIVLIEAKRFGEHQNQCAGVLSPPGPELVARVLGAAPPSRLFQRQIKGYVLYGERCSTYLDGNALGDAPAALRRVELDRLLMDHAERLGVQVVHSRATDVEVNPDGAVVYTESGTFHGDAVVGAFALDDGMARAFARHTRYRAPASLETLACKIHPAGLELIPGLLDDCIHVFLPRLSAIDFGALIPKGNHIVVVIAGTRLALKDMRQFMALPQVARLLPENSDVAGYFKGAFPLGPARGLYGDRYVVIGDAAGLVRPFKGKGINSALQSGQRCARAVLTSGLSRRSFAEFTRDQRHLTRDVWYGRFVRRLTMLASKHDLLDPFIEQSGHNRALCQALFDCVSGRTTYRDVVLRLENISWFATVAWACIARKTRIGRP